MKSFFNNKGPFDINFLLKKTIFTKVLKLKKTNVKDISSLRDAKRGEISFLDNTKYTEDLEVTNASFCLIKEKQIQKINKKKTIPLISTNPLLDFILIAKQFYPDSDTDFYKFKQHSKFKFLEKQGTFIDNTVTIGKNFKVGINTVLKKNVKIGDNVTIGSNCVISNAVLEDNTIINDGTIIGKIGYGFKKIKNNFHFIPHLGFVWIKKNCYIGSNCTIDRGSFSNTVIGENTIVDNGVHFAHNVKIGPNCIIAGQVGIAGSTDIGKSCMIGGQAGISGHLKIGDNVQIGGHSGVLNDIPSNSKVMGYPAVSIREFVKRSKI